MMPAGGDGACLSPPPRASSRQDQTLKNSLFAAALGAALLLAPAPAPADEGAETRRAPRIIYGQSAGATFDFDTRPAPRRKGNVDRQAYFGSGAAYDEALAGLRRRLQRMTDRKIGRAHV